MATLVCVVCKTPIGEGDGDGHGERGADGERFVLLRGRREEVHCSQVCLVANVDRGPPRPPPPAPAFPAASGGRRADRRRRPEALAPNPPAAAAVDLLRPTAAP